MIDIDADITEQQINRINSILGGIQGAPERAFKGIINRGLTTARSESDKRIREIYKIKQKDIKGNQTMTIKKPGSDLTGEIRFAGTVIPLMKFGVKPANPPKKRKPVSVSVLLSSGGMRLVSAYVTNLGLYGVGVFQRETSARNSSKQLYGPSPAHMMKNVDVLQAVEAAALETIETRVEQEISRILNGYV